MRNILKIALVLIIIALGFTIAYVGRFFLIPIALAGTFALMVMPISRWLEKKNVPHWLATLLPVLMLFAFLTGLILLVSMQISALSAHFDKMYERFTELFSSVQHYISKNLGIGDKKQMSILESTSGSVSKYATMFLSGVSGLLFGTLVVTIYTFFLLHMRHHFKLFMLKLIPKDRLVEGKKVISKTVAVVPNYIGGLSIMIVILWVLYGIGFSIVGVQGALIFAILCGVLELIPFVGNLVGTSLAALMVLAQGGDTKMLIGVGVVYLFVQVFQGNVLQPMIVGKNVDINPFFTIACLLLGEMVWGIAGMLLAIPFIGMIKIICDNSPRLQPYGFLIGTGESKHEHGFMQRFTNKLKSLFHRSKKD